VSGWATGTLHNDPFIIICRSSHDFTPHFGLEMRLPARKPAPDGANTSAIRPAATPSDVEVAVAAAASAPGCHLSRQSGIRKQFQQHIHNQCPHLRFNPPSTLKFE
jgi:hypothetical protein